MECQDNVHTCNLSRANAELWYGYTADGYSRGSTPRLGAVICWHSTRSGGHVAIVEEIKSNGDIVTTNSAWRGNYFYRKTLSPPNYYMGKSYTFQGFIYNPTEFTPGPTPPTPTPTETKKKKFPWFIYARKFRQRNF